MEATPTSTARIVLVPGYWLGAWAWDAVVERLRERGLEVTALTLPGLDPDATDRGSITNEDHADAILAAVGDGPAVLVAHSGAAAAATLAIDRAPERIARSIWVDTAPVVDGVAMDAALEGDEMPLTDEFWAEEEAQGSMRGLTEAQCAEFRARAVPEPGPVVREGVHLTNDARLDVPATIIATAFTPEQYRAYADEGVEFLAGVLEHRALEFVGLPTGHWPMWSRPDDLAELIAERA